MPVFPNVPDLPGVPPIPRSGAFPPNAVPGLDTQEPDSLWQSANAGSLWGIFDSNNVQVVTPDSVLDFDFRKEFRVSNFPQAPGAFASYNKVSLPFETFVRMSKGGSEFDRSAFLAQIETVAESLDLYSIVSPEKSYLNCNVTRVENARKGAEGAYFLEVDVFFIQIRQVTQQYSSTASNTQNAQQPSAQPSVNQGKVQPQAVTPAVNSALNGTQNNVSEVIGTRVGASTFSSFVPAN